MIQSFAFLFAIPFVLLPIRAMAADSWQGKVVHVIDGATLDITKPDGHQIERAKLYAIRVSAPDQPGGDDAAKRMALWCHQWGDVAEVRPMG